MPWVRFDDQFPIHRKVDSLSDPAFRLLVSAIFWCARNLTDGWVPEADLDAASPRKMKRPDKFVPELVAQGTWHGADHVCKDCIMPPDGWIIHDYLEFQPSKAQVEKERSDARERQRRHRKRREDGTYVSHRD